MTITELKTLLAAKTGSEPTKSGNGYVCRCPAHEDKNASLSFSEGRNGLLLKCHAGCTFEAIAVALGVKKKDFFHRPGAGKTGQPNGKGKLNIVAKYPYNDANGKLLFEVCRLDPKGFRQCRPDPAKPGKWIWELKGVDPVPYRLPELIAAVKAGETVFIAEGEKDVAALVKNGFPATCNSGGAGKWHAEFSNHLDGAKAVCIIADKDEPGRKHAAAVAQGVKGKAQSVKVAELPDVAGKPVKDAHDFFEAGGTPDQLREIFLTAKEFEASPAATANEIPLPEFFYDKSTKSGGYWRKTPGGIFVPTSEKDLRRHLKFAGVRVGDSVGSFGLTKFEDALCRVQNENGVDHVFALAGHRPGLFQTEDGRKILVPRSPALIAPRDGEFPGIENYLTELFGSEQLPYFLGWQKRGWEDLYGLEVSRWRHHQMLVLVGEPDCGKSFLQMLITLSSGGREADPYLWMIGKTDFNEDLAEAEHWRMDDKNSHRDAKSRASFGGMIKQAVVNNMLAVHPKGRKQVLLPCFRRITISINDDPDFITVLPMLDSSVGDKIMILKCSRATMLPDWKENLDRFKRELPAFIHYLLHVHRINPEFEEKRFGVKSYHAPEVVDLLAQFEPHLQLLEIIDAVCFPPGDDVRVPWRGKAMDLQVKLFNSAHESAARSLLKYSSACGQLLAKLAKSQPARVNDTKSKGRKNWTIEPPP